MQFIQTESDASAAVFEQEALTFRIPSAQARVLRFVMRYGVKTRVHASPDIARIRVNMERMAKIAPDQPFGVARRERTVAGLPAESHVLRDRRPDACVIYLHGGAFVSGSPRTHRGIAGRIARGVDAEVLVPDYRLAPENPFPAAVEDAVAVYRAVLNRVGDPGRIALAGDSAGGNLTFALLLKLKAERLPMPAAAVGLSPFADFTASGDSFRVNAVSDPLLHVRGFQSVVDAYAPDEDATNPLLSPIFGDLSGLPQILIQCGSDEILRDDSVRLHAALSAAGVAARLEVWPRMPHVWQAFASFLPEAQIAVRRINAFLKDAFEGQGGRRHTAAR